MSRSRSMLSPPPRLAVTLTLTLVLVLVCSVVDAQSSAYPCHQDKPAMGNGVTCTTVALPQGMCSKCPLRPPNSKGQFVKCWDTYDTKQAACLSKVREYVAANPCDTVRADALAKLDADADDKKAHEVVDYFLYSVCEQCCDCVPMGANDEFYEQYKAAHSLASPALFDPARGNCAAHAVYDICKVLPKVESFHLIGQPERSGMPAACPMLNKWLPKNPGWQQDPAATISTELRAFLISMLDANECASETIWRKCYDLEEKQKHLGTPIEQPPAADEPTGTKVPELNHPSDSSNITDSDSVSIPPSSALDPYNVPSPITTDTPTDTVTSDTDTDTTTTTTSNSSSDASAIPAENSTSTTNSSSSSAAAAATATQSEPQLETSSFEPEVPTKPTSAPAPPAKSPAAAPTTPDEQPGGSDTAEPPSSIPEEGIPAPEPGSPMPQPQPGDDAPKSTPVEGLGEEPQASVEPRERECFPSDATVQLANGVTRRMSEVNIGDSVLVSNTPVKRYEAVYAFSHADPNANSRYYIRISTTSDHVVMMTPGHILDVNGDLVEARTIKVGDVVQTVNGPKAVAHVTQVRGRGLYNPHTPSGVIVVDGVLCTTFTHAVDVSAANALLSPLRALASAATAVVGLCSA